MRSTAEKVLLTEEPTVAAPGNEPAPAEAAHTNRWGPKLNILETAAASGRFKTLGQALEETHVAETLMENGPFTLFAPTDEAFAKMPPAELASLLADKPRLRAVLVHHVVAQKVRAPRERVPNTVTAVDGRTLTMTVENGCYRVENACIVETNLRASNGVIHAIDSVLVRR